MVQQTCDAHALTPVELIAALQDYAYKSVDVLIGAKFLRDVWGSNVAEVYQKMIFLVDGAVTTPSGDVAEEDAFVSLDKAVVTARQLFSNFDHSLAEDFLRRLLDHNLVAATPTAAAPRSSRRVPTSDSEAAVTSRGLRVENVNTLSLAAAPARFLAPRRLISDETLATLPQALQAPTTSFLANFRVKRSEYFFAVAALLAAKLTVRPVDGAYGWAAVLGATRLPPAPAATDGRRFAGRLRSNSNGETKSTSHSPRRGGAASSLSEPPASRQSALDAILSNHRNRRVGLRESVASDVAHPVVDKVELSRVASLGAFSASSANSGEEFVGQRPPTSGRRQAASEPEPSAESKVRDVKRLGVEGFIEVMLGTLADKRRAAAKGQSEQESSSSGGESSDSDAGDDDAEDEKKPSNPVVPTKPSRFKFDKMDFAVLKNADNDLFKALSSHREPRSMYRDGSFAAMPFALSAR